MKLTHHANGTYSLVGMNKNEVDEIRAAMFNHEYSSLEFASGKRSWMGMQSSDRDYFATLARYADGFAKWLEASLSYGRDTLVPAGKSSTFGTEHPHNY